MDDDVKNDETIAADLLRRRKSGASWATIADAVGLSPGLCAELVADALLADPAVPAEIETRLDLARLDSLLVPVWRNASRGDTKSVDQALKILGRRGELLSALAEAGVPGVDPDEVEDGETDASDRPALRAESPGEYLARVRSQAAGGAAVFHLVRGDQGDDEED